MLTREQLIENVAFAVAVGALRSIAETLHPHSRKAGICIKLANMIENRAPLLQRITQNDVAVLSRCIEVSAKFMDTIEDVNHHHIMLNLCDFCMNEIKRILTKRHFEVLNKSYEFFAGSDTYEDIRTGERVFTRLMTEVEIELAAGSEKC